MTETWRPIEHHPAYEVSDQGRVRRARPGHGTRRRTPYLLRPRPTKKGYLRVALQGQEFSVHSLVLEAFVSPRPPAHQGNHRNCDKSDNRVSNLEWTTGKENVAHARAHGLMPSFAGEKNGRAKLSDAQVADAVATSGLESNRAAAERLGVSDVRISQIRKQAACQVADRLRRHR